MKLVTHKSKNLLYRIQPYSNCNVQFGTSYAIATQISVDSLTALSYNCQYRKDSTYLMGGFSGNLSKPEKITRTFTTPVDLDYNQIVFGVNGKSADTLVEFPIKLKPSTTYTFTCNFTNITQGSISWKDMMLVEGSTVGEYEPYSYNLLDKWQYPATNTINGVTFTNNDDGTIVVDGTASDTIFYRLQTVKYTYGHIYLLWWTNNNSSSMKMETNDGEKQINAYTGAIFTSKTNESNSVYIDVYPSSNPSSVITKPVLYDLTLMYGAGNEPTTVDQFYTDHPELEVSPLGFIGLKNLEISNKNIKRLRYKTADGVLDLGIIPSNSGYILNKYNDLSEELLEENVEKDTVNYHIPDKTNILLNKIEGKTNKIVQEIDVTKTSATTTKNGVTCTNNRDGSWTVNGTSTATETTYFIINNENTLPAINGHTYCTLGCPSGGGNKTYFIESSFRYDNGNGVIYKLNRDIGDGNYYIGIAAGYAANNLIFRPQVFDLTAMYGFGKEPTTVEQFKKDYPQFFDEKLDGIWNVRTSGISTTGKNLFDISKWITSRYDVANGTLVERLSNGAICQGNNGTGDGDNSYSNGWFCPMSDSSYSNQVHLKAGTYTVSADYTMIENSIVSTTRVGCYLYGDHQYTTSLTSVTVGNIVKVKSTYTVEEGYYYPVFTLNSGKAKIENIQIELNSTATDYEHYTENKIDLLSTQTLNGINGVNDYIEVIDKGNGLYDLKKTQNIDSVDLGSLGYDVEGSNFVTGALGSVIKPPSNDNSVGNYVCQKYVNCALNKSFADGDFGVNSSGYLYFRNSAYTTATAFKTAMNGVILYYQLKTPVTTTIVTNLTYNQVSAVRTNGGLLLVNDNNNQKYAQPNVTLKENFQYKS